MLNILALALLQFASLSTGTPQVRAASHTPATTISTDHVAALGGSGGWVGDVALGGSGGWVGDVALGGSGGDVALGGSGGWVGDIIAA